MALATLPRPWSRGRRTMWWGGMAALVSSALCFSYDVIPPLVARYPAVAGVVAPVAQLRWHDARFAPAVPQSVPYPAAPAVAVNAPVYPALRAPRTQARAAAPAGPAATATAAATASAAPVAVPANASAAAADPVARAETVAAASAGGAQRALLDLRVNTVDKGTVLAYLDGNDISLAAEDVEKAGIHLPAGLASGSGLISLTKLRSELRYELDERQLALNLTVNPRDLPVERRNFVQTPHEKIAYTANASAYLNYGLTLTSGAGPQGFAETAYSHGPWSAGSGFSYGSGGLVRGLSNLVLDRREHLQRWTLGDALLTTGELGGTAFVGGVSVQRAFELNRYGIVHPMPGLTGSVSAPATADVFVNGSLVAHTQLQPGTFDLRDLPVPEGSSATHVVIRDALGNVQSFDGSYYFSSAVLRRGLTDYAYGAGFVRADATGRGYGAPAALARYRVGLSDALTAGARLETGAGGLASGGPFLALRTTVGEFQLTGAASSAFGLRGDAYALAYGYTGRHFTVATHWSAQSSAYANASLRPWADRYLRAFEGSFGVNTGSGQVGLTFSRQTDRDLGSRSNVGLTGDLRVSPRAHLSVSASNGSGAFGSGRSVFATLTMFTGRHGETASAAVVHDSGGDATLVGVTRPALGQGFGYNLAGGSGRFNGTATYQGRFGVLNAYLDRQRGADVSSFTFAGGMAAIGGRLFATQPITDGFALLDVGVPGVEATVEHRVVGRTDARGQLLATNLVTNYGNRVGFAQADVPLAYDVPHDNLLVAPPYRGGSIVRFETTPLRVYSARLLVVREGKTSVPRYGRLSLAHDSVLVSSDIGEEGEVEFQNLLPGVYAASIEDLVGTCPFRLTIGPVQRARVDLGTLTCVAGS